MAAPLREIPRGQSSRRKSLPTTIMVIPQSPDQEYAMWWGDPWTPEGTPPTLSPLSNLATKAEAGATALWNYGTRIIDKVIDTAKDLGSTVYAAATGEPPTQPGPIFEFATGLAGSAARTLPDTVQRKLGLNNQSNVAGYVTLPDGRKIPVAKYEDPAGQGARAQTDATMNALTRANQDLAIQHSKERIEMAKLRQQNDQWQQQFALVQRQAASQEELTKVQQEAAQIQVDRMKPTQYEQQYWWEQPHSTRTAAPASRVIQAIGPGVPGGVRMTTTGSTTGP